MRKLDRQGSIHIIIRVLGRFAVMVDADPPLELRISSRKGQALLAYLAMHPDRSASREHLAALFWGERRDDQARHNLRQCLVTLRRDLLKGDADILVVDANTVGLQAERVSVDADEFASLADSPEVSDLERAATLYRGEFLSEFTLEEPFDSWVQRTRSQLDDVAAQVFEKCAEYADARGDGKQAVAAAERLIAFDAFREDRQRIALRIFARYRGREFALTHADACLTLLKNELDVDPEPATQALIDDIRRGTISIIPAPAPDRVEAAIGPGADPDRPSITASMDAEALVPGERAPIEPADFDPGRGPRHAAAGRRARGCGLVRHGLAVRLALGVVMARTVRMRCRRRPTARYPVAPRWWNPEEPCPFSCCRLRAATAPILQFETSPAP